MHHATSQTSFTVILTTEFSSMKLRKELKSNSTVTSAVPQGTVLGLIFQNIMYDCFILFVYTLWDHMYDDILMLTAAPDSMKIVGFVDDFAVVAVAKYVEETEMKVNESIATVKSRCESIGLVFANQKTEAVLSVAEQDRRQQQLKLECTLQAELYKQHIEYASNKAPKVYSALSGMLPNIGGPKKQQKKIVSKRGELSVALRIIDVVQCGVTDKQFAEKKLVESMDQVAYVIAKVMLINIIEEAARREYELEARKNVDWIQRKHVMCHGNVTKGCLRERSMDAQSDH